jgi:hypothetical protein
MIARQILVNVGPYVGFAVNNGIGTWTLTDNTAGPLDIGAYDVQVFAIDAAGNTSADQTLNELTITPPFEGLAGDYNENGVVDAADYALFRKYRGTSQPLANDPIGGIIDHRQYDQWRANFGQTLPPTGSGSGSAAPSLLSMPSALPQQTVTTTVTPQSSILFVTPSQATITTKTESAAPDAAFEQGPAVRDRALAAFAPPGSFTPEHQDDTGQQRARSPREPLAASTLFLAKVQRTTCPNQSRRALATHGDVWAELDFHNLHLLPTAVSFHDESDLRSTPALAARRHEHFEYSAAFDEVFGDLEKELSFQGKRVISSVL